MSRHPELRSPLYAVPRGNGFAGLASNFVLHLSKLMSGGSSINEKARSTANS